MLTSICHELNLIDIRRYMYIIYPLDFQTIYLFTDIGIKPTNGTHTNVYCLHHFLKLTFIT